MYEWSDEHRAIAEAVRRFVDEEIRPVLDDLEFGDLAPYGILRKMFSTFGMDQLAREGFKRQLDRKVAGGPPRPAARRRDRRDDPHPGDRAVARSARVSSRRSASRRRSRAARS